MNKEFLSDLARSDRPLADTVSGNGQRVPVSSGAAILLIDDNPAVAQAMAITLRLAGHRLDVAHSPEEAHSRRATTRYDAILLDLNFTAGQTAGDEGLACLARIMADDPGACVIVITAHSGIRVAVAAMQAGARDFVMKPWRNAELVAKLEAAITRTTRQVVGGDAVISDQGLTALLGESGAINRVRALIRRVGPTSAGVIVTGPSGAGRTHVASAVHAASADAGATLDRIDLRDIAAWSRLEAARGAVILRYPDQLDAVAQGRLLDRLPPELRCLAVADSVDPLIAALRRRIGTVEIVVPSLRHREDDALLLARHFARLASVAHGRAKPVFSPAAEAAITSTAWPDEVRGLALAIERAVLLSDDGSIDAAALVSREPPTAAVPTPTVARFDLTETERAMIEAALRAHHHNVSHAAAALGLSRGALYRRMARYGL